MCNDEITKVTQIIQRADDSEVKIVVQSYTGTGLTQSIGVDVFRRDNPVDVWKLCSDRPHKDWRTMSREDYVNYGRSEMLRAVSHGEILKLAGLIGRPVDEISAPAMA